MQMARSLGHLAVPDVANLTAFDLFRCQLESGSTEAAVDAMKRLGVVAVMAGPAETVRTVLPYLTAAVTLQQQQQLQPSSSSSLSQTSAAAAAQQQQNQQQQSLSDELLLILGQQLIDVSKVVTDPAAVLEFLPLLERLASTEETVVRDQAVTVLQHLCLRSASAAHIRSTTTTTTTASGGDASTTSTASTNTNMSVAEVSIPVWMALVKRLAGADWFTAKVSCAGILPSMLQLCSAVAAAAATTASSSSSGTAAASATALQSELLVLYRDSLCGDDTPMVRRAAARNLGAALQHAGWPHRDFGATQVPLLAHDEQDSVRLLAVAALAQAGCAYGEHPTWTVQHWLPVLRDGSTDMSWYVWIMLLLLRLFLLVFVVRMRIVRFNYFVLLREHYCAVLASTRAAVQSLAPPFV